MTAQATKDETNIFALLEDARTLNACGRCDAQRGKPCLTPAGNTTRPHKGRPRSRWLQIRNMARPAPVRLYAPAPRGRGEPWHGSERRREYEQARAKRATLAAQRKRRDSTRAKRARADREAKLAAAGSR